MLPANKKKRKKPGRPARKAGAKGTVPKLKKDLKPRPKYKKVHPATCSKNKHEALCHVCKSLNKAEIELLYSRNYSPNEINARFPEVSADSVYNHVWFFKLDEKRSFSANVFSKKILERYGVNDRESYSDAIVSKALEVFARTNGEYEDTVNHNVTIVNMTQKELDELERSIVDAAKASADANN